MCKTCEDIQTRIDAARESKNTRAFEAQSKIMQAHKRNTHGSALSRWIAGLSSTKERKEIQPRLEGME